MLDPRLTPNQIISKTSLRTIEISTKFRKSVTQQHVAFAIVSKTPPSIPLLHQLLYRTLCRVTRQLSRAIIGWFDSNKMAPAKCNGFALTCSVTSEP